MNLISIGIIVTAIMTTLLILFQERGGGAGSIFGGGEGGVYQRRRGIEKFIFVATVILVAVFAALAILNLAYPEKVSNTPAAPEISSINATDDNGNPVKVDVTPVPPTPAK